MLRRASHGLCCIFTWLCCAAVVIGCVAVPCRWLPWSHHWRPGPHLLQVHLRCRVRTLHARHSSRALPVREPCPPVPSVGASWLPVSYGGVFCCWDFLPLLPCSPGYCMCRRTIGLHRYCLRCPGSCGDVSSESFKCCNDPITQLNYLMKQVCGVSSGRG